MKITEETIEKVYDGLIQEMAGRTRGLERDEAVAVARIGLLYAIRTWSVGMTDFTAYARTRIGKQLAEYKRQVNAQRRAEALLSLDARIGDNGTTFGDMVAIVEADQTTIDVALFIRGLDSYARVFVLLRLKGYNNAEIARMLGREKSAIEQLHDRVKRIMRCYFELDGESA